MSNPWFRMYSEFANDPKVQMLSEVMQRRFVMIMCLRCSNTLVTLHETEIAFQLRITDAELAETKALFIAKHFIDDQWNVLNWEKRQFVSDSSAARVSRFREKQKEVVKQACNVTVTKSNAVDTDTEQNRTDTKEKDIAVLPSATGPKKSVRKKAKTQMPENFGLTESLKRWASEKGHDRLEAHLENFLIVVAQHGYVYADWEAALKTAIRANWAKLDKSVAGRGSSPKVEKTKEQQRSDEIDGLRHMAHLGNADAIAKLNQMGVRA